ncbi:Zgrf1 [Columba guinea]|nr:Zgrf1 [Columba guinea]
MASQEFIVLYTHQKMKKSKTWQDGILRIRTGGNKAVLFDDKGQCLESIFIKSQVNAGDNLESERYLITIEAVKVNEKPSQDQPRKAETPAVDRNGVKPGVLPPRPLSVGLKRKFTPTQNSERVPSDPELSVDVLLTETGFVKEELSPCGKDCGPDEQVMEVNFNLTEAFDFNDTDNEDLCGRDVKKLTEGDILSQSQDCLKAEDIAQSAVLRLQVTTHGKKEVVECPTFDGENDRSHCTGDIPSQLCDNSVGDPGRIAEDSANQTRFEMGLLDDRYNVKEINQSQLSTEATNNKKDFDGCAARAANGVPWMQSKRSYLLPGDTNVNECHPKTSMFEKTENISCIATSRIISAMEKRTKDDVIQLGCVKSPDVGSEHLLGTKSNDNKPVFACAFLVKPPGPRSIHEDDIDFIREENFQKKSNISKESIIDHSSLALNVNSEVPPRAMLGSPSRSDLRQTQWTLWEPDMCYKLLVRCVCPTAQEKSSSPEECSLSGFKPTVKTRTPLVTVPATEKIPDTVYPPDTEDVQQSFGYSVVNLCNKSAVFPISAFGPEDRNYETSVFGEYTEDRQRKSVQPVVPNVTSQYRQSKWLKYQNSSQCDLITQNSDDGEATDDICAQSVLGMLQGDTGDSSAVNRSAPGSAPLLTAKSLLGKCCANASNQDLISERKLLSPHLSQTPLAEATQKVLSHLSCHAVTGDVQDITVSELFFPNVDKVKNANLPKRKISIPTVFQSHVHYKQIFKAALTGTSNTMLCKMLESLNRVFLKLPKEGKAFEIQTQQCSKFKKFMNTPARFDGDFKTKLYLKLSRKEHYSLYSKDDIWVVSKTLNFDTLDTFIASSAFFGPSSNNEVELLPLKGYCPSNWRSNTVVHALLVCNASGELTSLRNLEEHFNPSTLPLIPYLLKMNFVSENATNRVNRRKFIPPAISLKRTMMYGPVSTEVATEIAEKMIQTFSLNPDQATSLMHIAQMMTSCENTKPVEEHQIFPITIIRELLFLLLTFSFRFQCEKLVLVGDPKQLPPAIQGSESVHEKGLEQTLFDRLCLMGHKTILLRTQYRCHPAISAIANELFYEGNLIDGVSANDRSPLLDWLPTLCFYSVNGVEQIERDNSFYNMAEVHFTVKLIQALTASGIEGSAIGVITLYKSQMCKIQNLLSGVQSEAFETKAVQVSTVDAFQGAEKEIILLSCVRTRQFGFIDSEKRMNVALTRAKRHLLIVGNLACLSKNRLWGRVICHCKGWENGLQHVSQCEQQLNDILKCYLEKRKEEEQNKKREK